MPHLREKFVVMHYRKPRNPDEFPFDVKCLLLSLHTKLVSPKRSMLRDMYLRTNRIVGLLTRIGQYEQPLHQNLPENIYLEPLSLLGGCGLTSDSPSLEALKLV